jgi:hypothetical protein|nr:MAG TPA: hypothetical protein [Caudoviricetes sp.]
MYQNLQQLKAHSLEEIKTYKEDTIKRKAELEDLKAKGGKAWTDRLQEELDEAVLFLVDVDEVIEEKLASEKVKEAEAPAYVPQKGTEKMVHLSIVRGRRFNPMTGKEESNPYTQLFTYPEWQLFKKHFGSLGYSIMKVLHDPYGEAAEFVIKSK